MPKNVNRKPSAYPNDQLPGYPCQAEGAAHHEGKSPSCEIARKRQYKQHYRPTDIRSHCVKIGLHGIVSQSRHYLGQEQRYALQWHTETDFNRQDQETRPVLEDGKTILEIEFLIHHRTGIDLHAVMGEIFLFLREEASRGRGLGQVEEGEEGEKHGAAAFDDEEIAPFCKGAAVDLEDAEG